MSTPAGRIDHDREAPARSRRRSNLAPERASQLLAQLSDLVRTEGFSHLTIADLANRLKCSRQSLYQLAPSKDELILKAIDYMLKQHALRANVATDSQVSRVEQLKTFLAMNDWPAMTPAFEKDLSEWEPAGRLFDSHIRYALQHRFEALVEAGVREGVFRPGSARLAAHAIFGATRQLRQHSTLTDLGMSYQEALAELHDLIIDGLTHFPDTERADARPPAEPEVIGYQR